MTTVSSREAMGQVFEILARAYLRLVAADNRAEESCDERLAVVGEVEAPCAAPFRTPHEEARP